MLHSIDLCQGVKRRVSCSPLVEEARLIRPQISTWAMKLSPEAILLDAKVQKTARELLRDTSGTYYGLPLVAYG